MYGIPVPRLRIPNGCQHAVIYHIKETKSFPFFRYYIKNNIRRVLIQKPFLYILRRKNFIRDLIIAALRSESGCDYTCCRL